MSFPPNIILVGFMGSGKTATGKIVSKILGIRFWDMDQWIEEKNGETVPEIFQEKGEAFFRLQEAEAVEWLGRQKNTVASTGGGAWIQEENRKKLLGAGWCVWLEVSAEDVWKRVGTHLGQRPLLANSKNPKHTIEALLEDRNPYYSLAHARVATAGKDPREVAMTIVKIFREGRPFDLPQL